MLAREHGWDYQCDPSWDWDWGGEKEREVRVLGLGLERRLEEGLRLKVATVCMGDLGSS